MIQVAEEMSGFLVTAAAGNERLVMFTEIPIPAHNTRNSAPGQTADFQPAAVMRKGDLVIAVKNSVSDRLLKWLLMGHPMLAESYHSFKKAYLAIGYTDYSGRESTGLPIS